MGDSGGGGRARLILRNLKKPNSQNHVNSNPCVVCVWKGGIPIVPKKCLPTNLPPPPSKPWNS